ncbi:MAG: spore cortex biosynthesis protein YabQ [Clostridium sp.]
MINPTFVEVNRFICALLSGVLAGILFDIYRVIKGDDKCNPVVTLVEDVLFWLLASILVFIFLLYTNYAYVSIYIYLLIFVGLAVYLKLFSRIISTAIRRVLIVICAMFRIVFKHMLYPLHRLKYSITKRNR